jgi:predicted transcriptional regulator
MSETKIQVSIRLTKEQRRRLQVLSKKDDRSQGVTMGRFIDQEWERRQQAEGEAQ